VGFAGADEYMKTDPEPDAEPCMVAHSMSCDVFTDATWMVYVVPKNSSHGIWVGDDGVVLHDDTGDHLIEFLSKNNETKADRPIIQKFPDECKLPTKVTGGKADLGHEFKLPTQATGAMTAVPGKSLQSYEHLSRNRFTNC
jgi:hypothetical protein